MTSVAAKIANSKLFQNAVIGTILFSAVVIGLETYPAIVAAHGDLLHLIDKIILAIFTFEVVVKLVGAGKRPAEYFKDPWNVFDFLIVAVCYVPINAQFVVILRLIRVLRLLKLITALPRLQLIVGALLKSVPSIGYIGILLSLHFYIFAVVGVFLFAGNDPFRFGSLQEALLTLFQIATMENWAELMHTNMYGCDKFGYNDSLAPLCTNPSASPIAAPLYYVGFIIFGTMIILNLFIGVIMKGMDEMDEEMAHNAGELTDGEIQQQILARLTEIEARLPAPGRKSS
jgi:voltage-gated sodium channel